MSTSESAGVSGPAGQPMAPTFGGSWQVRYPEPRGEFLRGQTNDQLVHIGMELAAELWVVKRRLAAVEQQLVAGGVIQTPDAIANSDEARADAARRRDAFISRVFTTTLPEAE